MSSSGVWQLPAHAGSSHADFYTLKMEAIRTSETSVHSPTTTRRHTPEDDILHSHRHENLKSYNIVIISCYSLLSQTILVTLNESKTVEVIQILPKYRNEESYFDLM
jgi:hypothetical protein